MNIRNGIEELIGGTPLVELKRIEKKYKIKARLLVKLESANPVGSAKDRVALEMIASAERSGRLRPGGTVIEPTSGNTGIGLAAICAAKGYKAVIVMPDSMSPERRALVKCYGAELVLTPGEKGMTGAIEEAQRILAERENAIIAGQFTNPANPQAHFNTTGPEIIRDTDGQVDILVATIGSGGTITGTGRYLKRVRPGAEVIGVEPAESPLITKGVAGPHGIQGIGANFIPDILDLDVVDRTVTVATREAVDTALELARTEGLLCGISSGAALFAALREARKRENRNRTIVCILPDTGERYISNYAEA